MRGGAPSRRQFGEPDFVDQFGNGYRVPVADGATAALAHTPTNPAARRQQQRDNEAAPGARRAAIADFLGRGTVAGGGSLAPLWFKKKRGAPDGPLTSDPRDAPLVLRPAGDAARLSWAAIGADADVALRVNAVRHTGPSRPGNGPTTGTVHVRL